MPSTARRLVLRLYFCGVTKSQKILRRRMSSGFKAQDVFLKSNRRRKQCLRRPLRVGTVSIKRKRQFTVLTRNNDTRSTSKHYLLSYNPICKFAALTLGFERSAEATGSDRLPEATLRQGQVACRQFRFAGLALDPDARVMNDNISIGNFLSDDSANNENGSLDIFSSENGLLTNEAAELFNAYRAIRNPSLRKNILHLITTIAAKDRERITSADRP